MAIDRIVTAISVVEIVAGLRLSMNHPQRAPAGRCHGRSRSALPADRTSALGPVQRCARQHDLAADRPGRLAGVVRRLI